MSHVVFRHPFTCIVAGPTSCGKTFFVLRLIDNIRLSVSPPPDEIIWCYGEYQTIYNSVKGVKFHEGLPTVEEFDGSKRILLVIDDLLHETDERVSKIFTKGSHHRNIPVIYITQNLFHASKQNRTLNLNTHYLITFKNPRDITQISHLARQMYPGKSRFLVEAFTDATQKPYGYLFVDLKSDTNDELRVRTNILPHEWPAYVYLHK